MIPIEEHHILSRTDIADELADVRARVHRNNVNQQLIGLECQVIHKGQITSFWCKDILAIRTDPVSSSPSIDGKGLKLTVRVQNPVISAGPADPVSELNTEAVVVRTPLYCRPCIIDELIPNETIWSAKYIDVIIPPIEISSKGLRLTTKAGFGKAGPCCVV
jgi:hypothetical protein